jgi:hypothetical protein
MHTFKKYFIFFLLFLTATSCGPRSFEDFVEEGEGVTRSLIQDLKAIHTREQLIAASGKLQRQFDRLVSLMIAAEEFSVAHPELNKGELIGQNRELSDQLRVEMNRIYRLEGGRQMIEKCQEKALHRLDAFKKRPSQKVS